jgi:regulator of protease activity HflC (stomatin/prohibitin superfamily)
MASAISFCRSTLALVKEPIRGVQIPTFCLKKVARRKAVLQVNNLHCDSTIFLRQNLLKQKEKEMTLSAVSTMAVLGFIGWVVIMVFSSKYFVTIFEYEKGLKYRKGRFVGILEPGRYFKFSQNTTIVKIDARPRVITIPGQEVLSSDNVSLKVSITAQYEIEDANIAVNKIASYTEALYAAVQLSVRDIIGSLAIDEVLAQRTTINQKLMEATVARAKELGLKITLIGVKDIMFPGELKKIFAKVVEAQKEGLAALERSRGETASLRNLANVSKVLEDNPALLQLRALQSPGNTFVFGMPGSGIPLKNKEA